VTLDNAKPEIDVLAAVRSAAVKPDEIALWYTGGAGYVVKTAGTTFLIDPFVGGSDPPDWVRALPPPFDAEAVRDVDAVLMTHEHLDHADPFALGPIGRNTSALAIGPATCTAVAAQAGYPTDRLRTLEHGQSIKVGDVTVTAVPAVDPMAKGCCGFVIETGSVTILNCGDSLWHPGLVAIGEKWKLDAICISVGASPRGKFFYMTEVDAARAARDTGARTLIPHHWDLWQAILMDPKRVTTAASWYCPDVPVVPAEFLRRITVSPRA
jgi:L-ascorbate 6-phosphate lactonase